MILNPSGGIILPTLSNPGSAADLRSGKQLISANGDIVTGSMATRTLPSPSISVNSSGTITATESLSNAGYYGTGSKSASVKLSSAHDSDFVAGNIKKGVTIFGVTGTLEGSSQIECYDGLTNQDLNIDSSGKTLTITLDKSIKRLLNIVSQIRTSGKFGYKLHLSYHPYNNNIDFYCAQGKDGIPVTGFCSYSLVGNQIKVNINELPIQFDGMFENGIKDNDPVYVLYILV